MLGGCHFRFGTSGRSLLPFRTHDIILLPLEHPKTEPSSDRNYREKKRNRSPKDKLKATNPPTYTSLGKMNVSSIASVSLRLPVQAKILHVFIADTTEILDFDVVLDGMGEREIDARGRRQKDGVIRRNHCDGLLGHSALALAVEPHGDRVGHVDDGVCFRLDAGLVDAAVAVRGDWAASGQERWVGVRKATYTA